MFVTTVLNIISWKFQNEGDVQGNFVQNGPLRNAVNVT